MKRTRVTNAFINFIHRTGNNYGIIISDIVRYCEFNVKVLDYDRNCRVFGRIIVKGFNNEEYNIYL